MPMYKNTRFRLLPLASFLLTSCNIHPPSSPTKNQISFAWHNHRELISQLSHYQTRGAFAYISNKQKIYARFNWQQHSMECYRLLFTNLLGFTEMDLTVQPSVTHLINNQGKHYISNNPEMMIANLAGIDIPLHNLRQWMLGLPGDATDFTFDAHGYLSTLSYQDNNKKWTVNYQEYHNDTVPALPATLELRHGETRIKLKIDRWRLQ